MIGMKAGEQVELRLSTTGNIHFENKGAYCGECVTFYFEDTEQGISFPNHNAKILISERP